MQPNTQVHDANEDNHEEPLLTLAQRVLEGNPVLYTLRQRLINDHEMMMALSALPYAQLASLRNVLAPTPSGEPLSFAMMARHETRLIDLLTGVAAIRNQFEGRCGRSLSHAEAMVIWEGGPDGPEGWGVENLVGGLVGPGCRNEVAELHFPEALALATSHLLNLLLTGVPSLTSDDATDGVSLPTPGASGQGADPVGTGQAEHGPRTDAQTTIRTTHVSGGDFYWEKLYTGDPAELRCAICGEGADSLDDMSWAEYRFTLPHSLPEGFAFHTGRCAFDSSIDAAPLASSPDWDDYVFCDLVDTAELARRRSRLAVEELRELCVVFPGGIDAEDAQRVMIFTSPRGQRAYCLSDNDEAYIRLLHDETEDPFERSILAALFPERGLAAERGEATDQQRDG